MSEERIALAVIAGQDAIDEGVERMLSSVIDRVHGVFIADTTSEDGGNDFFWELAEITDKFEIHEGNQVPVGWEDDFSIARNRSFELVHRHEIMHPDMQPYDWIFWLDCDDVLPESVDLQKVCATLRERRAHGGFMRYDYQYDTEHDIVLAHHPKERIFRADVDWRWCYPIHENCYGPIGTRMMTITDPDVTVRHLRSNVAAKHERNRRIIKKWFDEAKDVEPRAVMHMAHQTVSIADETEDGQQRAILYASAIKLYREFIDHTPASDDAYACNHLVAECLRALGRWDDAINIELQGIKMEPTRATCYVGVALTHMMGGDYEEAIAWARMARHAAESTTSHLHVVEPLDDAYKPLMIEGDALMKLERFEEAEQVFEHAFDIYPDEFTYEKLKSAAQEIKLQRRERVMEDQNVEKPRDKFWGAQPEKSIAFFVPKGIEPWNPSKLGKGGLGGTETCVIHLAEQLACRGWRVAIFGDPGEWQDKVIGSLETGGQIEWYRDGQFHPDEPFTVFVALRNPEILDGPINAQHKILWLHDVTMGDVRYGEYGDRFSRADSIVTVSQWHADHIAKVYKFQDDPWLAMTYAIPNGFDRELFDYKFSDAKRDPYRIVYASSPDRGLPRLLDLWPDIVRRIPEATLDVFYGWESIDAIIEAGHPTAGKLQWFKEQTVIKWDRLKELGYKIHWHGRVNQDVLAKVFKRSGIMAYPASFCETFGIVFAQAMMAGVVPVVPQLGNLPDLVGYDGIVVPGPPDSQEFGPRFVDAIERATHPPTQLSLALQNRTLPFTWEKVADQWEMLITKELVEA